MFSLGHFPDVTGSRTKISYRKCDATAVLTGLLEETVDPEPSQMFQHVEALYFGSCYLALSPVRVA